MPSHLDIANRVNNHRVTPRLGKACAALLVLLALCDVTFAENWDRFRGPNGAGQSDDDSIPTTWQPANTLWKQPLSGVGHSSPVAWDDKIYLTCADPKTGSQLVLASDQRTGAPIW